ncbi:MAG: HAMP domain-containing histidine kinase [Planctomycetia bacterium]|nr:HAMP domain-containing histidine kinase [Planctomycetia bacterium]
MIQPVWFGNELVLARRVVLGDQTFIQGCWLDWAALKRTLAAGVSDLLPEMDLVPAPEDPASVRARNPGRMLATISAKLIAEPPAFTNFSSAELSPVRLSLLAAWVGLGLASLAVAILLRGVLALSERRAAFVSAVTHELRTPLTTFRMYSEMLAEGMVQDESQQRHYLTTLKTEADRLFHLIENVLSYARLERGRRRAAGCTITVGELLTPIAARLRERAERDDMQLVLDLPEDVAHRTLTTDAGAIEQVLVNLVDNACKYAAAAADRRIHLQLSTEGKWLRVRVSDHGPGIATAEARRLFQPFTKSASEAAQTAPGVGLGLALSRRLAGELGGKLQFAPRGNVSEATGAAFVLFIRLEAGGYRTDASGHRISAIAHRTSKRVADSES